MFPVEGQHANGEELRAWSVCLDGGAEILFRGDEPIALGQRAVALLKVLVGQAGTPVSKDALIEGAWPGLAVEESNLRVQIAWPRRSSVQLREGQVSIERDFSKRRRFHREAADGKRSIVDHEKHHAHCDRC
jgi:DNA-binding winged helix-turn-helix (wHTH) protein